MPDYQIFDLEITTLTPLHIGTGRELLHEYDYEVFGKKTWVINQASLLEARATTDDPKVAARLAVTPPTHLLEETDFIEDKPWFRYVISGQPRSVAEGIQVQEQLKNVFDQPYLPGSSLKGAFRTLIGWHAWHELGMSPDASRLKDNPKFAGSNLEAQIFGPNPNNDLLRALQVSDSQPLNAAASLRLLNVRILNPGGELSAPVEMEAIRSDSVFRATMKIDTVLFSDWAKRYGLRLEGADWLKQLPEIARAHARDQIARELAWTRQVRNAGKLLSAYETFRQLALAENQFLMRLGWGTGWDDKTFGSRLQEDEDFMEYIIHRYDMSKGQHEPGDPFPSSRRAAMSLSRGPSGALVETPATPLGWVLVEMKAR